MKKAIMKPLFTPKTDTLADSRYRNLQKAKWEIELSRKQAEQRIGELIHYNQKSGQKNKR